MAKGSVVLKPARSNNSSNSPKNCAPKAINRRRSRGCGYPSLAALSKDHWEYRRWFHIALHSVVFGDRLHLMRLELVTRAFNSDSFCGLMVSQYGAVFVSLRLGCAPVGSSSRRPRHRSESSEPVL